MKNIFFVLLGLVSSSMTFGQSDSSGVNGSHESVLVTVYDGKVHERDLERDSTLIQLSGVVVDEETLEPLAYTTVYDISDRRGVLCDFYGYFSLVTRPGDTLYFSSYGYRTSTFIVPDTLVDNRYSIIHVMNTDTLNLPEVTVYPWPSREQFAQAFLEMRPYDDAMRRAEKQLSGESLAFAAARLQNDASYSYSFVQNQYQTKIYTHNQLPANNLLNPYAWAKLVKDWKEGKLSKQ